MATMTPFGPEVMAYSSDSLGEYIAVLPVSAEYLRSTGQVIDEAYINQWCVLAPMQEPAGDALMCPACDSPTEHWRRYCRWCGWPLRPKHEEE